MKSDRGLEYIERRGLIFFAILCAFDLIVALYSCVGYVFKSLIGSRLPGPGVGGLCRTTEGGLLE